MDYIEINDLLYEYFLRDEEGNVEGIQKALDGVTLSVKEGDFISILGRNGSGKSTLAKLINALLVPAGGSVFVEGKDTKDSNNVLSIRMNTGMVFQNPDNQIVAGIVEEDVAFGPENIGVPSEEIRERVEASLKTLNMWEERHRSPNHLSGGQKQRVAIAGVLALGPKCIVFDEATSMLDPTGRQEVIKVARDLNKNRGMTVILITHNMEETIYSDFIYVMDEGRVILEGTPKEVFKNGEFLEVHGLSVPGMTKIANLLLKEGIEISPAILDKKELVKEIMRIYTHGNNS